MNSLIDMSKIVDGFTLAQMWQYYTVNVKYLGTVTHEQFCKEYPESAAAIAEATRKQQRLKELLEEV